MVRIIRASSRLLAAIASLVVALTVGTAQPAAACTGGIDVWWAIERTRGDVVVGRITSTRTLADFSVVLGVEVDRVIRGTPRATYEVRGGMGAVCDQSPDVGRTVLILEGVRVEPPTLPKPLFYIIGGPGGYASTRVEAALAGLPDTAVSSDAARSGSGPGGADILLCILAGLLGALAVGRRLGERHHQAS